MQIQLLKKQSTSLFLTNRFRQGLDIINQCIAIEPNNSQLYNNRALYQYNLDLNQQAVSDLNHSISLDYLNYKAYFNLFSIQIQSKDYQQAFKNICCCLSVAYLLIGFKENDEQMIQKSIQYSFNNKQSRMMKSIYKMQSKKYIQALNQINYALYLHPGNTTMKKMQKNIYKLINMKEITSNSTPFKQKYIKLETNKIVPPSHLIHNQIKKLVNQFNLIMKKLNFSELYIVKKINDQVKTQNSNPKIRYYEKEWCVKVVGEQLHISGYSNFTYGKNTQQTTQSFNPHITMKKLSKTNFHDLAAEPQGILDTSMSNLSISNISQDSIIKMSRINRKQLFDLSQCFKSQQQPNKYYNSLNFEQNSYKDNVSEQQDLDNKNIKINLPKQMIEDLKENERVVLSFQKMQVDKNGAKKETKDSYELILNNENGCFQLIKLNK